MASKRFGSKALHHGQVGNPKKRIPVPFSKNSFVPEKSSTEMFKSSGTVIGIFSALSDSYSVLNAWVSFLTTTEGWFGRVGSVGCVGWHPASKATPKRAKTLTANFIPFKKKLKLRGLYPFPSIFQVQNPKPFQCQGRYGTAISVLSWNLPPKS